MRQPSPAASHQHREPDDDGHCDCNTGAQEPGEAREQTQPVAPIEGTVVICEHELHEPEEQRAAERDLEGNENVLAARAEQHEATRQERRDPRAHTGPPQQDPNQRRDGQVREDDQHEVRHVGPDPEDDPEQAVDEDRQGHQVIEMTAEPVTGVTEFSRRKEVPIVLREPCVAAEEKEERERAHLDRDERDERPPTPNAISQPRRNRRLGLSHLPPTSGPAPDPSVSHTHNTVSLAGTARFTGPSGRSRPASIRR